MDGVDFFVFAFLSLHLFGEDLEGGLLRVRIVQKLPHKIILLISHLDQLNLLLPNIRLKLDPQIFLDVTCSNEYTFRVPLRDVWATRDTTILVESLHPEAQNFVYPNRLLLW